MVAAQYQTRAGLYRFGLFLACMLLAGSVLSLPARARESAPLSALHATATLISDTDAIAAGQPFRIGLRIRLAKGWHTYGSQPGDAGIPPELALTLPKGARSGPIAWPPTETFHEGPLVTHGYTGEVVLAVRVTAGAPNSQANWGPAAGPIGLTAHATWLVCKDICIPEEGSFQLDLASGTPAPSAEAPLFEPHAPATSSAPSAAAASGEARPRAPAPSMIHILALALAGGLILNLMPCVFPVLAMKAVALATGAQRGEVRAHAVSYSAGVLLAFAGLGGALLALRTLGASSGWGFQFQSPVFVTFMAWLLFAIGLNLSGVFEFGGRFMGSGRGLAARGGHAGSFFTGLLAVVVATPCTAPFMGAAIAAALAAPPATALAVFLAMGVGLAAPTLVLAASPGLARLAPRPGRWMFVLRQALAFPMYAAAAWLVWVLSEEAGSPGVLASLAGLVLIGFAAWAYGAAHLRHGAGAWLGRALALAACLAAAVVLSGVGAPAETPPAAAARNGAEPFSPARLAALRAEGRPVFVNMTAAWCVSCLLNERVAIQSEAVRDAFAQRHIAYLKGDWTRQAPEITAFLREHGRDGVPLYLYYPPGGAPPAVLPQLLTEQRLLDAVAGPG